MSGRSMGLLHGEHVLLGASFLPSERTGVLGVDSYPCDAEFDATKTALCDLTGSTYLLAHGADARRFAELALAGSRLAVGEASFEAVLSGDASLIGAPLVARTGDGEYVVLDASPAAEGVGAWLEFLSAASEGERRAFDDLKVEDAVHLLVPLVLLGPGASEILRDYLGDGVSLPRPGTACQLMLDAIGVVVVAFGDGLGSTGYLVLVPPARARVLWRSLLSFEAVCPVGRGALSRLLGRGLPWHGVLDGSGPASVDGATLRSWGLLRDGADFVGGRSLA